jgi:hypothetical protein
LQRLEREIILENPERATVQRMLDYLDPLTRYYQENYLPLLVAALRERHQREEIAKGSRDRLDVAYVVEPDSVARPDGLVRRSRDEAASNPEEPGEGPIELSGKSTSSERISLQINPSSEMKRFLLPHDQWKLESFHNDYKRVRDALKQRAGLWKLPA